MLDLRLVNDAPSKDPWTIVLPRTVFRAMLNEAAGSDMALETGGILLGHDDGAAATTRLTQAGGPGPLAVHRPRYFLRDLDHAQRLAEESWQRDGSQWVGEWHTHPLGIPVPSQLDVHSYLTHVRDPDLGFQRFVSLILAWNARGEWVIGAWIVNAVRAQQAEFRVVE